MVNLHRFLGSVGVVLAGMLLLSVVESFLAFRRSPSRRSHLGTNLPLGVLTLATNLAFTIALGAACTFVPARPMGLALLIAGVVLLDFSTYVAHRAMHAVPFLWRFHRVHHADPLVDVTTTLRQHPGEGLVRFAFIALPTLVFGLPLEVVAIYRLISTMNGLLEHTNVRLFGPLDRVLAWVVVSPDMHKVHHSEDPRESDSNFGNILSAFDRLLRTFTTPTRCEGVRYGLGAPPRT